mmetsp:Transcript_16539/g.27502  ORF Transcript_16539/g.27502 Transcript_16539/m.27502 type:complete len:123 (+) Transcript_16539:128-496(+)
MRYESNLLHFTRQCTIDTGHALSFGQGSPCKQQQIVGLHTGPTSHHCHVSIAIMCLLQLSLVNLIAFAIKSAAEPTLRGISSNDLFRSSPPPPSPPLLLLLLSGRQAGRLAGWQAGRQIWDG